MLSDVVTEAGGDVRVGVERVSDDVTAGVMLGL